MAQQVVTNIALPIDRIRAFCQKWGVRKFALFGSVLREDFNDESDVDVLLEFRDDVRYGLSGLVQMGDELEDIFGRSVDLIDRRAVEQSRNYIRREIIFDSAEVIYAE